MNEKEFKTLQAYAEYTWQNNAPDDFAFKITNGVFGISLSWQWRGPSADEKSLPFAKYAHSIWCPHEYLSASEVFERMRHEIGSFCLEDKKTKWYVIQNYHFPEFKTLT